MADSFLSFANSTSFRDTLLTRNLPPYSVSGSYSPGTSGINQEVNLTVNNVVNSPDISYTNSAPTRNYLLGLNLQPYSVQGVASPSNSNYNEEINISVSNVINSPDEFISQNPFGEQLYSLNSFGPDGGYGNDPSFNPLPLPVIPNQGEYNPNDTKLDLINEFFIDAAYVENVYGPAGGFQNLITITNLQLNNKIYAPYWDPPTFVPSVYSPYSILLSNDPVGDNGLLSQDSFIAVLGAKELKRLFEVRVAAEIYQNTVGAVNLESLSDPFEASLIATGREPLVYRDYRITVPEFPLLNAFDFATRIASAYWPVSFIPGDYFIENVPNGQSQQVSNALNVINQLTGGFLGPILNKTRNPSEIFLANTGNAQRSFLFNNIDYNRYQPSYDKNFGGILGVGQAIVNLVTSLINPNGTLVGGYYVGSKNAEPSTITSPPGQVPVNAFGQQEQSPVYGPSELGILFEGNSGQLNFGLRAKSLTDGGAIDGEFVWVSPKYKGNAGFKPTPGGGVSEIDNEYSQIRSNYERDQSTNLTFKETSILDETQRLVNSADNVQGITRLKHVGNAINQVSKVFNDGYKELTKGSQVVRYTDNTTGGEKGIEYCRVFAKDTPYYTYADLQKKDGITTSGRRFTNSVLDNTYNLNIAPLKNPGSTNIQENAQGKIVAKKYMFSIENLAWRTSSKPGYTYDELPVCERGPNGGRVMWFPPYNLSINETSQVDFNKTSFIGRPEPMYTYKDTSRGGTLSWTIIVDSPSVMNTIVEKKLKNIDNNKVNSVIDSFFAGCTKFDIIELAKQFNSIPINELYTYQEILNKPNLTQEQIAQIVSDIPSDNNNLSNTNLGNSPQNTTNPDPKATEFERKYKELAFYFDNDQPNPNTNSTTTSKNYENLYNTYTGKTDEYKNKVTNLFDDDSPNKNVGEFFEKVITNNFEKINSNFIQDALEILQNGGTISMDMVGSASASASKIYNENLSARRNESVINYFKEKDFGEYITNKKFIIQLENKGEIESIPLSSLGFGSPVNCTENIISKTNTAADNKLAQTYSVAAMACRRVKINNIVAKLEQAPPPKQPDKPLENKQEVVNTAKPQPTIDIQKQIKEGIGKKVLRTLFSECDYFEVIKEENPMIYNSIREKIKFFNPSFHSMTPEGLNARLTFLNQCGRPGETIPIIGTDGNPKVNDAINTSFGAPPILVLRIGDFYHTKIVPTSIGFTYDPLIFDLNPEGIGVQPMLVKVSMNFNYIGGSGLAKPVEELQNALSFNYFANTEIYDERATPTEDYSVWDKNIVDGILANQPPPKPINQQQNDGGTTIGTIITNIVSNGVQTGEISYQKIMDSLVDQTKTYFINTINQLEKINNNTDNGNYGLVQLINSEREFSEWEIYDFDPALIIYGKPKYQQKIDSLFKKVYEDIETNYNIILKKLEKKQFKDEVLLGVSKNMISYIKQLESDFSCNLETIVQELCNNQIQFVQTTRKINLVNGIANNTKTDGLLLSGNVPRVYTLTEPLNVLTELNDDYKKLLEVTDRYNDLLITNMIVYDGGYNNDTNTFIQVKGSPTSSLEMDYERRFYIIMSRILTNKSKRESFLNTIITPNIENLAKKNIKNKTRNILEDIGKDYEKNITFYEKKFADLKKNAEYLKLTDGIENEMYKKGNPRKVNYTTVDGENKPTQEDEIKDLYLNIPKFN